MVFAVNSEGAMDARLRQLPFDVIRNEGDVRVPIAFENGLMHRLVPRLAAGIAAFGVNNDGAGGLAGREVVTNGSVLQFKGAVDAVKNITECELDVCLSWIELEHCLLSKQRHGPRQKDQND